MAAVPEIYGVSDLRVRQNEILAKLREGPVVLTQRTRAVAVMLSPERWNELLEELDNLQDAVAALQARLDAAPAVDLDTYTAKRDGHVSGAAE